MTTQGSATPILELQGVSKRFVKPLDTIDRISNLLGAGLREEVVVDANSERAHVLRRYSNILLDRERAVSDARRTRVVPRA